MLEVMGGKCPISLFGDYCANRGALQMFSFTHSAETT